MTKTVEKFAEELDAAFAQFSRVSKDDLKKLFKYWELDFDESYHENSLDELKTSLKKQFESWPDVLKDKVTISLKINGNLDGSDRFLSFKGADLTGANLSGADLSFVDLSGADLSGANLIGATLRGVKITDADQLLKSLGVEVTKKEREE